MLFNEAADTVRFLSQKSCDKQLPTCSDNSNGDDKNQMNGYGEDKD